MKSVAARSIAVAVIIAGLAAVALIIPSNASERASSLRSAGAASAAAGLCPEGMTAYGTVNSSRYRCKPMQPAALLCRGEDGCAGPAEDREVTRNRGRLD